MLVEGLGLDIILEVGDEPMDRVAEVDFIETVTGKRLSEITELAAAAGRAACSEENCCLDVVTTPRTEETTHSFYDHEMLEYSAEPWSVPQVNVGVVCSQVEDKCEARTIAVAEYLYGLFGEAIDIHQEAEAHAQNWRQAASAIARGIRKASDTRISELMDAANQQADRLKIQSYAPLRETLTADEIQAALAEETEANV